MDVAHRTKFLQYSSTTGILLHFHHKRQSHGLSRSLYCAVSALETIYVSILVEQVQNRQDTSDVVASAQVHRVQAPVYFIKSASALDSAERLALGKEQNI